MDGNGRWARKRLMPRTMGHRAGMSALKKTVEACAELGIRYLTVFAFSTENWKRPRDEVDYLMTLLVEYLHKELNELNQNGIRVHILGDYRQLPPSNVEAIDAAVQQTARNTGMVLSIAINYGSRAELMRAVKKIAEQVQTGELAVEEITEEKLNHALYTVGLPDPDLLIRTAGEMRISNFLLWQIAYAELWFSKLLWPDFDREELLRAIGNYQQRERRFGAIKEDKQDDHHA